MYRILKTSFVILLYFLASTVAGQTTTPGTGMLLDDDDYARVPLKARNIGFWDPLSAMSEVSLKRYVPPVGNQGYYGTCVGWSTAYYGRTILHAATHGLTTHDAIDGYAFSPAFTYHLSAADGDEDCSSGAYIQKALQSLVETGGALRNLHSVDCAEDISDHLRGAASDYLIKDFNRLFAQNEATATKINSVKRALANSYPVIIGFMVEQSLFDTQDVYIPDGQGTQGGHAMCVIGFDDNRYGGAFEVVNSWGTSWGNEGFAWIRYDDFAEYARYAYEMIPHPAPQRQKHLKASVRLELNDGSTMAVAHEGNTFSRSVLGWQQVVVADSVQSIGDYQTTATYPAGTRYRMHVDVDRPAYVYVLGADSDNRHGALFPHEDGISPYLYQESSVHVPSTRHWFQLHGNVDSDYSIVLFSEDQINIADIIQQLDEMDGPLLDKLYLLFNNQLVAKDDVSLSANEMAFEASYQSGRLVMVLLDIKRH